MTKTKNSALQLHWPYFTYSRAIYGSWLSYWSASCPWCKSPSCAASCLPFILSPPTRPSCPQLRYLFLWPHRITTPKQTKLFPTSHLCTRWPVSDLSALKPLSLSCARKCHIHRWVLNPNFASSVKTSQTLQAESVMLTTELLWCLMPLFKQTIFSASKVVTHDLIHQLTTQQTFLKSRINVFWD